MFWDGVFVGKVVFLANCLRQSITKSPDWGKTLERFVCCKIFSKSSEDVVQRKRKCFPELKKRVYPEELLGCPEKEVRIKG